MKRDTKGKFVPNWESEAKQQVCITLTATAQNFLEAEAQRQGISRSEVIEHFARRLEGGSEQSQTQNITAPVGDGNGEVNSGEAVLHQAEQKITDILESISDAFVAFDRGWHYTYVNHAATQLLQKTPEELLGKHVWNDVFPSLVGELPYHKLNQAMTEQIPVSWQEWGEPIGCWLEVNAYPSAEGIAVYFRDITERKQAEQEIQALNQALEERVTELQTLLDVIPVGIAIAEDPACQVVRVNSFFQRLLGVTAIDNVAAGNQNPAPISFKHFHSGIELSAEELPMQVAAATGKEICNSEIQIIHSDGNTFDLIGHATPLFTEQGTVRGCVGVFMDITERKRAEVELQESEERYRRLFEHNPQPMWIFDAETLAFLAVNEAAIEHYGYSKDEFLAMTLCDIRPPEDIPALLTALDNKPPIGLNDTGTWRHLKKDGTLIDVRITSHPETFLGRKAWLVLVKDVTEQIRAETALRQSEEKYRSIVQTANEGIWLIDAQAQTLYCNDRMAEMLGYTPTELLEQTVLECCFPDDIPSAHQRIQSNLIDGNKEQFDFRFRCKDGNELLVLACTSPLVDGQGAIVGALGMFTDVTARKKAEAALQESEEKLRMATESANLGMWYWDGATDTLIWTDVARAMFGIPDDTEMTMKVFVETIHPDDLPFIQNVMSDLEVGRQHPEIEYRIRWADGTVRWILARGNSSYTADGTLASTQGVLMDITDRKQAEESLRQSEERLRLALLVGKAGIWDWDIPKNRVTWSEQIYKFHGLTPGKFGGRVEDFAQLIHPDDQAHVSAAIRQTLEQKTAYEIEFRAIQPDETVRWLSTSGGVVVNAQGEPIRMLGATRDITERKAIDEERERLLLSEQRARTEAESANRIKDEFLAVLSHELRSPLNPILGWARLLQTQQFDEERRIHALETIERNAKLQTQLIDDLLDVSRILRGKLTLNVRAVNLVTVIESALETVRLAAEAKQIEIQSYMLLKDGKISGDAARLQQIVWNLVSNAVKFTPNHGQIEVRLERIGNNARIQVKDTGKGITPSFLPYVFDYFRQEDGKTTRKFGGLGLGLAIVRHLTELHGGTVHAESLGEAQGATFTVKLPLLCTPTSCEDMANTSLNADLSQLKIIVVDDDEDMRELAQFILEQQGAQVVTVASAAEVLLLFDRQPPDLLISDIGMPEIDGYMLMQQIRQRSPERGGMVPAIALTAYAGEYDQQKAIRSGFQKHISKPVEPEALISAIADLKNSFEC